MPPPLHKAGGERDEEQHTLLLHVQTKRMQREIVEVVVGLLASLERSSVSCRSLLGLRRIAIAVRAGKPYRREIESMIGAQLDKATLDNILIPALPLSRSSSLYDVDLVLRLVDFFLKDKAEAIMVAPTAAAAGRTTNTSDTSSSSSLVSARTESGLSTLSRAESRLSIPAATATGLSSSSDVSTPVQSALTKVGDLMDKYLVEIAADTHLRPSRFLALVESLPDYARECDDGLYRAVDIYLEVSQISRNLFLSQANCIVFAQRGSDQDHPSFGKKCERCSDQYPSFGKKCDPRFNVHFPCVSCC
jgi:hypothetical protein